MFNFKRVLLIMLSLTFMCSLSISPVNANSTDINYDPTCPLDENIDPNDIIDAEIIDGELYIDVLFESDPNQPVTRAIGKCPASSKTIKETVTRKELADKRNQLAKGGSISSILGWLIGFGNPIIGDVVGFIIPNKQMIDTMDKALMYTTKSTFTVTSIFACETVWFGQRGYVHRYRLSNVIIN